MTIFAKKPKNPAPNATKIQNVPLRPALDFLDKSHMIKNKKAINTGNNPYSPNFVIVSLEIAIIIIRTITNKYHCSIVIFINKAGQKIFILKIIKK